MATRHCAAGPSTPLPGTATEDVLETDDSGDLPGRDPRRVGREHRYGYLTGTRENPNTVELGDVIKHDFANGTRDVWDPGPTRHAVEPLFVPGDAADTADDAGWLLSFVHDDATGETVLAVLDATAVPQRPGGRGGDAAARALRLPRHLGGRRRR